MAEQVEEREQAVAAFAAVATPEEKAKVGVVEDSVVSVVAAAQSLEVRTADEAAGATEFLAHLAAEKKRAEEARTFLVKPLNDHVKAINDRFRGPRTMLEQADGIVREKVITYNREVERRRREEQERLDAERRERERLAEEERRRAEARAREEREAAAREAARAEAEARRAAEDRLRQVQAANDEAAQAVAGRTDDELAAILRTTLEGGGEEEAEHLRRMKAAARYEIATRAEKRRLEEAAAAARQREEEARAREEEERNRPLPDVPETIVAPTGPLRSGASSASTRKVWKATVVDPAAVPRDYLVVDEKAINRAVREGVRSIHGVRIEQVDALSVRARIA